MDGEGKEEPAESVQYSGDATAAGTEPSSDSGSDDSASSGTKSSGEEASGEDEVEISSREEEETDSEVVLNITDVNLEGEVQDDVSVSSLETDSPRTPIAKEVEEFERILKEREERKKKRKRKGGDDDDGPSEH
ncbi:hypothetical protein EJB05_02450 [Eragrostis curvula]|uniref:Uncharacterized protein n=1 Tax=Eragrostis curvula TaxID=38414 RepID=A0A5J9WT74_9POAL|nr:hypothetical protein EJB05_02450 [Eragrostis curvula]